MNAGEYLDDDFPAEWNLSHDKRPLGFLFSVYLHHQERKGAKEIEVKSI
jgi:hypothetical protein